MIPYPIIWTRELFKFNTKQGKGDFQRACDSIGNKLSHLILLTEAFSEQGLDRGPAAPIQSFWHAVASNLWHVLVPFLGKLGDSINQESRPKTKIPAQARSEWLELGARTGILNIMLEERQVPKPVKISTIEPLELFWDLLVKRIFHQQLQPGFGKQPMSYEEILRE